MRGPRLIADVLGWLMALIGLYVPTSFAASLSSQELQVVGTALAFVQPRPAGKSTIAVVYAAGNSGSRNDAEAVMAAIGSGLPAAGGVLTPKLVEAGSLAITDFGLAVVASGANSETVMNAARARHALCVTGDQAAVQQGICTMAVRSGRHVEIFVNYQAAQQAGIGIATAFRMMVHEL
jgi:hypothetical protein